MNRTIQSLCSATLISLLLTSCVRADHGSMVVINANESAGRFNAEQGMQDLRTGDTVRAHDHFMLAQEQAPNDPLTLDAVAYYYEKSGDFDTANDLYFKAMILAPNSGTIRNNYGAFLCRNGYSRESILYLMRAARVPGYADAAEAYANAKFCAERLGDKTEYAYYTKLLRNPMPKQVQR